MERSEPKNDEEFSNLVADIVAKVMTVVDPGEDLKTKFHPVLGMGGYEAGSIGRSA